MADYVYEQSGGRLKIDLYAANALGEEAELMEGLVMGTVDLALLPPGIVASYAPEMQLFDMPFLFSDWDHVDKVLYGEIGNQLIANAEKAAGITIYSFCEGGFRSLVNNEHPILEPSDLEGLKIRVPDWKGLVKTIEKMGGIPVIVPFGEVYSACASGLVDGQEGTAFAMRSNAFYEVCTYYSLSRHIYNPMMFCACTDIVGKLDADLQQILLDGAKAGAEAQIKLVRESDDADMVFLSENGMIINEVNDITEFSSLCTDIYGEFSDVLAPELIQAVIDLR
jgi:tripartite ATP-independent transporter DctP family solute receptor